MIDADQILVMDDGMIEASGTHEELLAKSRVYRGYLCDTKWEGGPFL